MKKVFELHPSRSVLIVLLLLGNVFTVDAEQAAATAAASKATTKSKNHNPSMKKEIINVLHHRRHLFDDNVFNWVSDTCGTAMKTLYNESTDLANAYEAYDAAERVAFQNSCTDIPSNGFPTTYNCRVTIGDSIVQNLEKSCIAAGGILLENLDAPSGAGCCGEIIENYVYYGYTTNDYRLCIPKPSTEACLISELTSFYPQGIFQAAMAKFEGELNLQCGGSCDPAECTSDTLLLNKNVQLLAARSHYYSVLEMEIMACRRRSTIEDDGFNCGNITVDQSKVDDYRKACENAGGYIVSSEPFNTDCLTDTNERLRFNVDGTLACVSSKCNLESQETQKLVDKQISTSPFVYLANKCSTSSLCHGYITGYDSYIANGTAKPISCDEQDGKDYVFPSFQDRSCCSGEGRYYVKSGQVGGFDAEYNFLGDLTNACRAYTEALSLVLCDPRQGDFIEENILRICRSSCDLVFDKCGLPGEQYSIFANYNDGTSLCYDMFGGFGFSFDESDSCFSNPNGYVCQAGLSIQVVDDHCLSLVQPTEFDESGNPPVSCGESNDQVVSRPICPGYITGADSFIANEEAKAIPCGGKFGDEVFPSFQDLSCCSGEGRYFVQTGQIGGFDAGYDSPYVDPTCSPYVAVLSSVLCDPRLGEFTMGNVLRICRSSCDRVFDACGLPGQNFVSEAKYNDGTSLCYDLFGGFDSSPCESRPDGYPCKAGLSIEVVDENCFSIVEPPIDDVNEYGDIPTDSSCFVESDSFAGIVFSLFFVLGLCGACCCISVYCYRNCCKGNSPPQPPVAIATATTVTGQEGRIQETPVYATATPTPSGQEGGTQGTPVYVSAILQTDSTKPSLEAETAQTTATAMPLGAISNQDTNYSIMPPPMNPSFEASAAPAIAPVAAPEMLQVVPLVEVVEEAESHRQEEVVQTWIRDHPGSVGALTPEDISCVLSKVSFSLHKASIAKTLASGLSSTNSLTCAHVVAAMKECSLEKSDVAKAMAPYVNDPHKKDDVLNALDLSFERNSVSMCFRE